MPSMLRPPRKMLQSAPAASLPRYARLAANLRSFRAACRAACPLPSEPASPGGCGWQVDTAGSFSAQPYLVGFRVAGTAKFNARNAAPATPHLCLSFPALWSCIQRNVTLCALPCLGGNRAVQIAASHLRWQVLISKLHPTMGNSYVYRRSRHIADVEYRKATETPGNQASRKEGGLTAP